MCRNHLLLKAILFSGQPAGYLAAARSFSRSYRSAIAGELAAGIEHATTRELSCLLLARIDGKSGVEYITDEPRRRFARTLAGHLLTEDVPDPLAILDEAEERLRSAGAGLGAR